MRYINDPWAIQIQIPRLPYFQENMKNNDKSLRTIDNNKLSNIYSNIYH